MMTTAACEHEQAEHDATAKLTRATWVLCLVTAVLVIATVVLAAATMAEKAGHEAPTEIHATEEVQQSR